MILQSENFIPLKEGSKLPIVLLGYGLYEEIIEIRKRFPDVDRKEFFDALREEIIDIIDLFEHGK